MKYKQNKKIVLQVVDKGDKPILNVKIVHSKCLQKISQRKSYIIPIRQINVTEYRRSNQKWTIERNWQQGYTRRRQARQ